MNIGYLIQLSAKLMKGSLHRRLEKENFTVAQWAVIKDIEMQAQFNANVDHFTAVAISERLDMDKPTISGIINRLVEKGFVEKKPHPKDKRSQIINLTDATLSLLPKLEEMNEATIEESLKDFSESDKELLVSYLNKLVRNLKGD
ncbi:MAG: MarR family winged helix-turn-helix transcriptional regulator [Anaerobacillus sp.]|uniref:MarR family winged helix-turn-helix transcriptional regulator n=1 Tax=Anaerobacillus sp. TaxID=1872506 RepID=UPI00391DD2B2